MTPRLLERYQKEILPALGERLGRTNRLSLPRLEKIVINMGVGAAVGEKKYLEEATDALALISGQKPTVTQARKSVAGFRLREGMSIGCRTTLRGVRMYEFLDRFISTALPRIRDFRGISGKAFDGRGNYSIGLKEQFIFPEIDYDKVEMVHGLDITFCTTAKTDEESKALLRYLGMPFKN